MSKGHGFILHTGVDGDPCYCWYGGQSDYDRRRRHNQEHYGAVHEAAQYDYLRKREDIKRHPTGQQFLQTLKEHYGDEYDRYFPWIAREWKQGRLKQHPRVQEQADEIAALQAAKEMGHREIENPDHDPWYENYYRQQGYDDPERYPTYRHVFQRGLPIDERIQSIRAGLDSSYVNHPLILNPAGDDSHLRQGDLRQMHDWYEWNKARGQTPNLASKDDSSHVQNVLRTIKDWENDQDENFRNGGKHGQVVHDFGDGWTIRHIGSGREAHLEGKDMNHCIGKPHYGYPKKIDDGKSFNYSLRDSENRPHATFETYPKEFTDAEGTVHEHNGDYDANPRPGSAGWTPVLNGDTQIAQIQGPHDAPPSGEARPYLQRFLDHHGLKYEGTHAYEIDRLPHNYDPYANNADDEEEEEPEEEEPPAQWWNEWYDTHPADTVSSYYDQFENGDTYSYAPDEYDRAIGDYHQYSEDHGDHHYTEPELNTSEPDYDSVFRDALPWDGGQRGRQFDPNESETLLGVAGEHNHIPEFADLFNEWKQDHYGDADPREVDPPDDPHRQFHDLWERELAQHRNPETGNYEPMQWVGGVGYQTAFQNWWNNGGAQTYQERLPPQLPGFEWSDAQNPDPLVVNRVINSHTLQEPPLYYRWTFDPATATVEVAHNGEAHPTEVRYHRDLARNRGSNLVHGYAYRIGGGWRLTDWDHQPVKDPFVVAQVMRHLAGTDPFTRPPGGADDSWQFSEPNFDALHHGIPTNL